MRAVRILVRLLVFVVLFVLLTVVLVWAFGTEERTQVIALRDLRKVGFLHLEEYEIYLVEDEGNIHAVSDHFLVEGVRKVDVTYCERSGLFEGEWGKFDSSGRYYGGSAPRGLTTYPVEVEDGAIFVELREPIPGLPRIYKGEEPVGPFCERI